MVTIRTSSTSSGGTWAPELADATGPAQRRARARRRAPPDRRLRPDVDQPPAGEPERLPAPRIGRMGDEHEPRAGVRGLEHAAPAARGSSPAAAGGGAARPRARSAARPRRCASGDRRGRAAAAPARRRREQRAAPRPAGGGRGSGRGRPGTATGSGPSGRRPTGARGAAGARPQWRSPNSESSCSTSSSASRRPRTGPIVTAWPAAGSRGDLEDRERDVEPAADVDEPVVVARSAACCRAGGAP